MSHTSRRARRAGLTAALALATTLTTAGIAFADNIVNDVFATTETIAMNVGGPTHEVEFSVDPVNGDGKNGCNLTGSTTLTVTVASSNPAVATVSPSSITFGTCDDLKPVTVTAIAAGAATISLTQTGNTTAGSFNLAPATFHVDVAQPANTAPQVSVTGVDNGGEYQVGTVPAAGCSVIDAEDGNSTFAASLSGDLDDDDLGFQTATCSYTDAGGLKTEVSATYEILDGTAPVITYTLTPPTPDGLDGWWTGSPQLVWTVTEPDSPSSLVLDGCNDVTISADQQATDYSCSATSSGGSAGPVTVTVKRDGNGPVVSYVDAIGTEGDNGWYVSPVTANFSASDAFSGVETPTGTTTSTGDGTAVVLDSPAFTDRAGNTTGAGVAQSPAFKIDTVEPSVGDAVLSGTLGEDDWYTSSVTASFPLDDATSGVVGDNPRQVSSGDTQGPLTLVSPEVRDVAGNVTPAGAKSATVKVDSVAPSVGVVGGPADGSSHYFGSVPAAPTCEASDATSGLAGACSVSGYGTGVGPHTVTATVTDQAGNTSSVSRTYTVLAWTTKGFYSPVDMNGVFNKVKGGSTVPLKFELFAGPTELTTVASVSSFGYRTVQCDNTAPSDELEMLTSGSTTLRYDATGGQFIQNWKVPSAVGCYRATMTALDGSAIQALFKVTK